MRLDFPSPSGMDIELALETRVFKLSSLHYGLWATGESLTLENLTRAQRRYTEHLLARMPAGVATVLDVGAGLGDNAASLAQRGLHVTALSPDPGHRAVLTRVERAHPEVCYVQSRFEDFAPRTPFDLVLMSESSNYFALDAGLERTTMHLRPGGHLLLAGLFRRRRSEEYQTMHVLPEYLSAARRMGFALVSEADITEQVAPSLDLGRRYFDDHVRPAVDVLREFYAGAYGWKTRLLAALFRSELALARRALEEFIPERLDSAKFRAHVRYAVLLLRWDAPTRGV